jgi:hypothetical protein
MKRNMKIFGLLLAFGIAVTASAQENYKQWTGHQRLWLNTQSNGAGVGSTILNFPVLVRLTTAQTAIFTAARAGGADIRFSKADTLTKLPYQIERWDTAAKAAEIWVLVDTIRGGNSSPTVIMMHWGKVDAVDSSKGSAVFLASSGFQAVYHFNQDAASPMLDATANALNATPTSVTNAAGIIGPAKSFDGTSSRYDIAGSAGSVLSFPEMGNYTVSAWVNETDMPNAIRGIVTKGDAHWTLQRHWSTARGSHNFEFFERNAGWNAVIAPATPGVWKHLTGVRNGADMAIYVDGALVSTEILISSTGAINSGTDVAIGVRGDNGTRFWNGLIDEVNISSVSRSADWIRLTHENQKAAQTLVAFTQPTALRDYGLAHATRLGAKPQGSGLLFSLPERSSKSRLSVSDMWGRTVWSRVVDANTASVSWNGASYTGQTVARGMYLARLVPVEEARQSAVWEAKVALTR